MLVSVQQITKSFLDDIILNKVSLAIKENDRIGLLGANAAGKTTLLNIIAGNLSIDSGSVQRARDLEIGYLQQNNALENTHTLNQEARVAFARVHQVQQQMLALAKQLETTPHNTALLAAYDQLVSRFEALDGYQLEQKITRVLTGLGFASFSRETLIGTLSGGEKMRFAIAKMLLRQPDLLILDEPTNHLDFEMLAWLENYLLSYQGAVLVVSHDRYFLDTVAKDICELEHGQLSRYKGGYASFITQKAAQRRTAQKAFEKQQVEIAKMEEYVRKNMARASTSNSAASRVKQLEKMQRLQRPYPEPKTIMLRFDYDLDPFTKILSCENVGVRVGENEPDGGKLLYANLALEVQRGEKIALVGLNGVGKTTFLKAIQNLVPHSGRVQWGGNVRIGYFDQELAGLDVNVSVLEAVHSRFPTKTEYEIRNALGRMLLEGEDSFKKVHELSGAGRAKVAFAILVMQRANVLLLDEPTNHLDYRAKEVLEHALNSFAGTLFTISHDRYFLRRVPDKILEMRPDGFETYIGNYDAYLEKKKTQQTAVPALAAPAKNQKANLGTNGYRSKAQRAEDAKQRTRTAALEKEIARLELAIKQDNHALTLPENTSDYEKLSALGLQLQNNTALLDDITMEWLVLTS